MHISDSSHQPRVISQAKPKAHRASEEICGLPYPSGSFRAIKSAPQQRWQWVLRQVGYITIFSPERIYLLTSVF